MKKYICILAGAALLAACEQKTETVAPATSPPAGKTESNTTIINPSPAEKTEKTETNITLNPSPPSSLYLGAAFFGKFFPWLDLWEDFRCTEQARFPAN